MNKLNRIIGGSAIAIAMISMAGPMSTNAMENLRGVDMHGAQMKIMQMKSMQMKGNDMNSVAMKTVMNRLGSNTMRG